MLYKLPLVENGPKRMYLPKLVELRENLTQDYFRGSAEMPVPLEPTAMDQVFTIKPINQFPERRRSGSGALGGPIHE